MKVPSFDPRDSISTIRFLATFNLACNTNNIRENAAMWALPFFVKNAIKMTCNCSMSVDAHKTPAVALVNTFEPLIQKKLRRL